jgi:dihydrofolate reductase
MANIVLAADGSTDVDGSSSALSFPADRSRFHQIRKSADVIIVGGETARSEPYGSTDIPLIILSRTGNMGTAANNPLATTWNLDLVSALNRAKDQYQRILIEAGPSLLITALTGRRIDLLYVTISDYVITPGSGLPKGSPRSMFSLPDTLAGYSEVDRQSVAGGVFVTYTNAPSHE